MPTTSFHHLITALHRVCADGEEQAQTMKEHLVALINVPRIRYVDAKGAAKMLTDHLAKALKASKNATPTLGGGDTDKTFKPLKADFIGLFDQLINPRSMRLLLDVILEAVIILDFYKSDRADPKRLYGFSKPGKKRIEELLPVLELVAKSSYDDVIVATA